jgi:superfamily II DNA helicase RecQ
MQIKLFTIPIASADNATEELNRFLKAHKVLEVENQLVSNEKGASWCFCVKFIEKGESVLITSSKKGKDYKNELDEATFKIFYKLREIRKNIAQEEAIPAFAICTDEELAGIAKLPQLTTTSLLTVKGFGAKKLEKYGERILQQLNQAESNEASR